MMTQIKIKNCKCKISYKDLTTGQIKYMEKDEEYTFKGLMDILHDGEERIASVDEIDSNTLIVNYKY